MVDMTTEQFEAATKRGKERLLEPRAQSAHYDSGRGRVIVRLTTGVEIGFAPRDAEGLAHASREALSRIEVEPFGLGIHFPLLDADFYVPALLQGSLGSEIWMAARRHEDGKGQLGRGQGVARRTTADRSGRDRARPAAKG